MLLLILVETKTMSPLLTQFKANNSRFTTQT